MENEEKIKPNLFARGTFLYYVLVVLIVAALLFGIFDPRKSPASKRIIGVYKDYKILAVKQGEDIWEITLREKNSVQSGKNVPIEDAKTILWYAQKEFRINNYHLLEENGKTKAIIITVGEN